LQGTRSILIGSKFRSNPGHRISGSRPENALKTRGSQQGCQGI
jgi:hypothetical protein